MFGTCQPQLSLFNKGVFLLMAPLPRPQWIAPFHDGRIFGRTDQLIFWPNEFFRLTVSKKFPTDCQKKFLTDCFGQVFGQILGNFWQLLAIFGQFLGKI